jgi:hypothetical protein
MSISTSRYSVKVTEQFIAIVYDGKEDVLYWDIQELKDDPTLAFNIVQAIKYAYEAPGKFQELFVDNVTLFL